MATVNVPAVLWLLYGILAWAAILAFVAPLVVGVTFKITRAVCRSWIRWVNALKEWSWR